MLTTHLFVPRRNAVPVASRSLSEIDRLFDQLWSGAGVTARAATAYAPRIDFTENEKEFSVAAELPGVEEKDIQVSFEDSVLTIRGERNDVKNEGDAEEVRHFETFHGKYERSLRLPADVDADGVKAVYRNGILTVTLPKAPQPQPRLIQVTSGS